MAIPQEQIEEMRGRLSKVPAFQWIKTENAGAVCHFKDLVENDGQVFVEFDNETRINFNLLDEFVLCLEHDQAAIPLNEPNTPVAKINQAAMVAQTRESPIQSLLKKQKPNMMGIDIKLEINLPPKELYTVLCQSFDDAEKEVVEYVIRDINVETIRDSVRTALKNYYENIDN